MKFGGASVKNAEAVRNVARIIRSHLPGNGLMVVISAMDKTTNHLEQLAWAARDAREDETWKRFRSIRDFHHGIIDDLFGSDAETVRAKVADYFAQIERIIRGILLLNEFPTRTYDRIVAFGELLSTTIVAHFLRQDGIGAAWVDAREIIKTDASFSQASVIWSLTRQNIQEKVLPLVRTTEAVITQGFIASNRSGKVTTLGREGSDYTASIFANCLEADSLTVWKDVRGILNGDPRIESETVKLDALSYERAVEMTFYGASVIHPKTIKPLRNAAIPLYVKCFKDTSEVGTVIAEAETVQIEPQVCSRIVKKNQLLLRITPRDFSFMDERLLGQIFTNVARAGLQVNLVQITAISLTLCATHTKSATGEFESLLLDEFEVERQENMVLRTFIDYTDKELVEARDAVVSQQSEGKLLVVREA